MNLLYEKNAAPRPPPKMFVGLERLFQASTGIKVRGYEVNRAWWESPHSALRFIKLGEEKYVAF